MEAMLIDLRSDTVTRPSAAMREVMARADVGDDIVQEDPTVQALERRTAELLGKEAALYMPSGHMSNQVALRAHSQPGDAVICHEFSHVYFYETGSPCAISGLTPRLISTPHGWFTPEQISPQLLPLNIHHAHNRILSLENTHNRCGGAVWPLATFAEVADFGRSHKLAVHLDGARLWNACAATGTQPQQWAEHCDTLSVCFSKGLGAPVGSALAGPREFVERARFFRKMFGGQMRQAGIIAAGALFALDHNRERLAEDHTNAASFAAALQQSSHFSVNQPETNIVMIDLTGSTPAAELAGTLKERGVLAYAIGPKRIRVVTHLDVTAQQCAAAADHFIAAADALSGRAAAA
jgi:threonine aldolase